MRFRIGFFAVLLFLGGCSYFEEPGTKLILNLDNEFEVSMHENLRLYGRELNFVITSIDDVKCDKSELVLSNEKVSNTLRIIIDDLLLDESCESGSSNPSGDAAFDLRTLIYELTVEVKDHTKQTGVLEVTDDMYRLNLDEAKGLIVEQRDLNRIPDNFAWGFYQAKTDEEKQIAEAFLSDQNLAIRPLVNLREGFYSFFSIDSEGKILMEDLPTVGTVVELGFQNVDIPAVKRAMNEFKAENPNLNFTLNLSDGTIL